MAELKVGALAIIINSRLKENIGATVRLTRYMGIMRGHVMDVELESWQAESANGRPLQGYLPNGMVVNWDVVNCPAKWLMPIDGDDFQHEGERQKELSDD
ncbi:hypothetical protein EGJ48_03565 [Pantoea dispersa]|uniref:hypothetical protein n=1 Tax=Pantoea dispersa TaxID=59814 RepID=UPI000F659275|nr:hypothetical protein [Pantoea dispersa]RRW77636.1 hypothetical protein EGJ48_03565 [Pantoea dispersa]